MAQDGGRRGGRPAEEAAAILDRIATGAMETKIPSSTPARDRLRDALEAALPAVRALIEGPDGREEVWTLTPDPAAPDDFAAARLSIPEDFDDPYAPASAHGRLAREAALRKALAPLAPLFGAAARAGGGGVVLEIDWRPERTRHGQTSPPVLILSLGPAVKPWSDTAFGADNLHVREGPRLF